MSCLRRFASSTTRFAPAPRLESVCSASRSASVRVCVRVRVGVGPQLLGRRLGARSPPLRGSCPPRRASDRPARCAPSVSPSASRSACRRRRSATSCGLGQDLRRLLAHALELAPDGVAAALVRPARLEPFGQAEQEPVDLAACRSRVGRPGTSRCGCVRCCLGPRLLLSLPARSKKRPIRPPT